MSRAGRKNRGKGKVIWQLAFQMEKHSHGARPPPLNLPELASSHPSWLAVECIISKPKDWAHRNTFSLGKGPIRWLIPGSGGGPGGAMEVCWSPLLGGKTKQHTTTALAGREMQVKTALRYHLTSVIMAIINKTGNDNY